MAFRHHTEGSRPLGRLAQVDQYRDLHGVRPKAYGMIPAPPILVPVERSAVRVFHAYVAGDPAQVSGAKASAEHAPPGLGFEHARHERLLPAERRESVVRTLAARW